jgi:hypothetical protein
VHNIKPVRAIALAAVTGLLVLTSALPAAAYTQKYNGGSFAITTNRTATFTLRDRTPRAGVAQVFLQKKAGPRKCRVNKVIFNRAGQQYYVGPFEKWARTRSRAGAWAFPNNYRRRDATIQVTVRTNGRCIVGVGVK